MTYLNDMRAFHLIFGCKDCYQILNYRETSYERACRKQRCGPFLVGLMAAATLFELGTDDLDTKEGRS